MSKSIPVGKKLIFSLILGVIGFLLIYILGLGISDSGAAGMALGLFLGVYFAQEMLDFFAGLASKKITKKKTVAPVVNDAEVVSIFVGNLAFKVRGRQLAELFEPYGAIESIRIVKDRNTGRGKGFGFVDMKAIGARKAIAELDGSEFFGRTLKVSEANAQKNE